MVNVYNGDKNYSVIVMTDNKSFVPDKENFTTVEFQNSKYDPDQNKKEPFPEPYAGMNAEMVRYYSSKPKYKIIRIILMLILLAVVLVLITLSVITIVTSAPCLESWQKGPIYQIYPISFYDTDADGKGDLKGIVEKMDYIESLGVKSVWLNPIYESPFVDNGYDVSDYKSINPTFGTMEDFESLLEEMHKRKIGLIMDFVPNHSSDQHEWFKISSDPTHEKFDQYKDYYVWADPNPNNGCPGSDLPNNWVSTFGGPAWTWSESRKQYYYHYFLKEQPDLNLKNPQVVEELVDALDFWLDKGVDGFRLDAVCYLMEADHLRNEKATNSSKEQYCSNDDSKGGDVYDDFTDNQPGMHDVLEVFRTKTMEYSTEPGVDKVMITECYNFDPQSISRYYGTSQGKESSFPFNFWLVEYSKNHEANEWDAKDFSTSVVEGWLQAPKGIDYYEDREWPNWQLGNHDNPRIVTKAGEKFSKSLGVLQMMLPGTKILYYGDEIGMRDVDVTKNTDNGGMNRDKARAPMQWDNSTFAGFTESSSGPWLPVDMNTYESFYETTNVAYEEEDENSYLNFYKKLISISNENEQINRGWYCRNDQNGEFSSRNVYSFIREQKDFKTSFAIFVNFGDQNQILDLKNYDYVFSLSDGDSSITGDSMTISEHGFGVIEFKNGGNYESDMENANCWISREVRIKGGTAYKI